LTATAWTTSRSTRPARTSCCAGRAPQWWESPSGAPADPFFDQQIIAAFDADWDGFQDLLLEGQRIQRGTAAGIACTPAWVGHSGLELSDPVLTWLWTRFPESGDIDGDGRVEIFVSSRVFEAGP
jgi:hypothetical protein